MGGVSGNVRLSRRARKFESEAEFANYAAARHLPKEALHRSISGPVWMSFMRGEFETAAFQAMKAVEVAVRDAARLGPGDYGVSLMRKGLMSETACSPTRRQRGPKGRLLVTYSREQSGRTRIRILIAMYHSPTQARPPRSSCSRTIFSELSMPAVQAISRWVRARPVSARTAAGRLGWSSKSAPGDGTERPGVAQSPRKVPGRFALPGRNHAVGQPTRTARPARSMSTTSASSKPAASPWAALFRMSASMVIRFWTSCRKGRPSPNRRSSCRAFQQRSCGQHKRRRVVSRTTPATTAAATLNPDACNSLACSSSLSKSSAWTRLRTDLK